MAEETIEKLRNENLTLLREIKTAKRLIANNKKLIRERKSGITILRRLRKELKVK